MLLSYAVIKYSLSPDASKNRYVQIIHLKSLVGNKCTKDSMKFIDILKKSTLGADTKIWIKGLKCGRKATQELQAHYDDTPQVAQGKKLLDTT